MQSMVCTDTDNYVNVLSTIKKEKKKNDKPTARYNNDKKMKNDNYR